MADMSTLPYPPLPSRDWCKKHNRTLNIREHVLASDLFVEQWIVPKGTTIKIWQTQNFGWIKVPSGQQDKRGFTMPRGIFKY